MLNSTLEKQDNERLIFKKGIPVNTALGSPFENKEDIILSEDFKSVLYESDTINENKELQNVIEENRIENAVRDLRKIPNNPFLLNNLGLAYLNNKEYEKAFIAFKQAIEIKHDFTLAALNIGSLYVIKNDFNSAIDFFNKLLERTPNDIRALINLGNIYFQQKKFKDAKDVYRKIVKIDPKNISSRNRLALLNLIEQDFKKAITELRRCLQINNELPAIYNNLGVVYEALEIHKKAIRSFKIALKIYPNYTSAIYNLAIILRQKDILASIELLEDYLYSKENAQIRELLARFYFENKQPQKALNSLFTLLSQLKHVINCNQEIVRLHNNIGVVYHVMRDFEKAKENYLTCIEKVEYINPIIVGNIIDLFFDLNKINEAKKYIDIYRDKFGEKDLYFYYLSRYSYHKDKLSDSIKFMKQFLMINKNFPPAYAFLSYIYSEHLQDYKKAIALNVEAFEHLPNNKVIINNLAYNYLMNNEVNKAEVILCKVEENTDNVFLNATRGLLNIKKGNIKEGRRLYNWAAELAERRTLHGDVIQKKYLELARYYLAHDQKNIARDNLKKVFSTMKGKDSIFTKHAQELQEQLVSEGNIYRGLR
jgi:tetratricopeptide (TPR) repeat protein